MFNRKKPLFYILEDNPVYRELIPRCISATLPESQVATFIHPSDMVKALARKPDLLVSEFLFQATGYDGNQILHMVRKKSPGTMVIFLTAHHNINDAIGSIRSGAMDYIPKSKTALDTLIQKLLLIRENLEYMRRSGRTLMYISGLLIAAIVALAVLVVYYQTVLN